MSKIDDTSGKKTTKDYIIAKCKKNIRELVYVKTQMIKARNYYLGYRDPNQYKHLEINYGLGNPDKVKFQPFIKLHIDELVGEYLSSHKVMNITCRDAGTLTNIVNPKLVPGVR